MGALFAVSNPRECFLFLSLLFEMSQMTSLPLLLRFYFIFAYLSNLGVSHH